jgi:hypothetical protein
MKGGYGQTPLGESLGGPTYCALASMHLVPAEDPCATQARLQPTEWRVTVRWSLHMQSQQTPQTQTEAKLGGGFAGRTNQLADARSGPRLISCFFFSPPSSLQPLHLVWLDQILGADHLLDVQALGAFLARCQYKFGGIGKAPDEHPGEHPCANALPSLFFLHSLLALRKLNTLFSQTHICRSRQRQSPRQIRHGNCSPSTCLSMRRTRLRDGPRSTSLPLRPASRNRSGVIMVSQKAKEKEQCKIGRDRDCCCVGFINPDLFLEGI